LTPWAKCENGQPIHISAIGIEGVTAQYRSSLGAMHACIQAHLFDAKQLQRACLAFIKENLEAVAITPGPLHRK